MVLPANLDPFAVGAATAVMTRVALNWMIECTSIDPILDEVSEGQYTREFLLGHFVQVMCDVACGFRRSAREAFLKRQLDLVGSLSAFYRKLGRMEPCVAATIVRETASRARELISAADGLLPEPIPGYTARILDGNILTGTDHRINELRSTRSAALPGMSLAIYQPVSGLVLDLILEENAHTQERALLDQVEIAPASSGSWIATSASGASCFGSCEPKRSSWSAGILPPCRSGRSSRCGWSDAATPARFLSKQSGSMIRNARGVAIACDGSS